MKRIFEFFPYLIKRIFHEDLLGLAAQMAYYFLLSMFPALIFVVTLLPFLPILHKAELVSFVDRLGPGAAGDVISSSLQQVLTSPSVGLLSFGFVTALWSASSGINAIVVTLNKAYGVTKNRAFIKQRALSLLLTLGMLLVLFITLALPVFGKQLGIWIFSQLGGNTVFPAVWHLIRWGLSILILFTVFTMLYWIGPNLKFKCRKAMPGAALASTGWLVSSFGFAYYIDNFGNFTRAYGSLGGTILLILWFYITGIFIIIGGEFNAYLKGFEKSNCP
ncbi:MAG: YihY/virulence factor BrkB family protein [Bacillales bacterium]|jgi:membrane protein|nr:YihY/virulence factor BrkB family protein [Bacillales bacterium]